MEFPEVIAAIRETLIPGIDEMREENFFTNRYPAPFRQIPVFSVDWREACYRSYNYFKFIFVTGDSVTMQIGHYAYRFVKNDFILLCPQASYRYLNNPVSLINGTERGIKKIYFSVCRDTIRDYAVAYAPNNMENRSHLQRICRLGERCGNNLDGIKSGLTSLMGKYLAGLSRARNARSAGRFVKFKAEEKERILAIENHIRDVCTEPLDVATMAARMSLSLGHFEKVFKKYLGETVKQSYLMFKMERAIDLLRNHDHTVESVSRLVGYTDAYYFSRLFKAYVGFTPSEYRRRFLAG